MLGILLKSFTFYLIHNFKIVVNFLLFLVSVSASDVTRNAGLAGTDEALEDYQVRTDEEQQ